MELKNRPYIRMSEQGHCRLAIFWRMVGEPGAQGEPPALRMGRWLEPMVVEMLEEEHGLTCHFTHDEIEVRLEDPPRVGHPDGLVQGWDDDHLILLEIKTMNANNWQAFARYGLDGSPWFKAYKRQVRAYLAGLLGAEVIVESDDMGRVLQTDLEDWSGPASIDDGQCLLVALNKDTGELAFHVELFDAAAYQADVEHLQGLWMYVEAGIEPPPDLNGTQPECRRCEFRERCPAVASGEKVLATQEHPEAKHIGILSAQIAEETIIKSDAEAKIKRNKEELDHILGAGGKAEVPGYKVSVYEVQGRTTPDMERAEALGIEVPMKQGASHVAVRVTPQKEDA